MKLIIIGKVKKLNSQEKFVEISFYGCFLGNIINKIYLRLDIYSDCLQTGKEYAFFATYLKYEKGILYSAVDRMKDIEEMGGYI